MMGDLEQRTQLEMANKILAYQDDLLAKVEKAIKKISDSAKQSWLGYWRKPSALQEIDKIHSQIGDLLNRTYPVILQGKYFTDNGT